MELQSLKQRYDILGDDPALNRALDIALQVAGTDLSVLVTGESGVGKEAFPRIIHQNSPRKHGVYIAVNCGAIPEGTIDSELFGHEKGSFTGANETRKGYFEVADGGTIFLDEVAELPIATQVRLLRVLQNGEFMKVGSSKVQTTNVRVVAATNVNLQNAVRSGKFREDLYYRLATVPIALPALRERKGDIYLLFRKFTLDFADKYHVPSVRLTHEAQVLLSNYRWPGNIRQLRNVAEQISILETEREIDAPILRKYLPQDGPESLPVLKGSGAEENFISDRDVLYKMLFSLKEEVDTLKSRLDSMSSLSAMPPITTPIAQPTPHRLIAKVTEGPEDKEYAEVVEKVEEKETEPLSLKCLSENLIKKSLQKHNGKRKDAAAELGISERTLYRRIKDLGL